MKWNWQQPDWPNFQWNPRRLASHEERFLRGAGVMVGAVKHLGGEEHSKLIVENRKYMAITGASPATATRDLGELVELGALLRTGERKHTRYELNLPLNP